MRKSIIGKKCKFKMHTTNMWDTGEVVGKTKGIFPRYLVEYHETYYDALIGNYIDIKTISVPRRHLVIL